MIVALYWIVFAPLTVAAIAVSTPPAIVVGAALYAFEALR